MQVHQKYTKGVTEVHAKYMVADPRGHPERTGRRLVGASSQRAIAEPGDTRQEPFAFQYPKRLAAGLPGVSVLLAEAGDGWCRPARLQCPVADLLADQRCQTSVRPGRCGPSRWQ
jgi:hypothetical protein